MNCFSLYFHNFLFSDCCRCTSSSNATDGAPLDMTWCPRGCNNTPSSSTSSSPSTATSSQWERYCSTTSPVCQCASTRDSCMNPRGARGCREKPSVSSSAWSGGGLRWNPGGSTVTLIILLMATLTSLTGNWIFFVFPKKLKKKLL